MKQNQLLKGVIAIMVTPRDDQGNLDERRTKNHLRFLIDNGFNSENGAVLITGSIGECACLTTEEKEKVWNWCVEEAKGQVPLIAGINHTNPDTIIDMAERANSAGTDLAMIMTPYYWKNPIKSIRDFFLTFINSIELPILLYNNIPATQVDLPIDLLTELVEYDNVIGIKECTPNFMKLERVYHKVIDKVQLINGNGEFWEPYAALMGCDGFVSGLANFAPQIPISIYQANLKKEYDKVFAIRKKLQPYSDYFFSITGKYGMSVEPELLKVAATFAGSNVGPSKLPVTPLNAEERKELEQVLADCGLI